MHYRGLSSHIDDYESLVLRTWLFGDFVGISSNPTASRTIFHDVQLCCPPKNISEREFRADIVEPLAKYRRLKLNNHIFIMFKHYNSITYILFSTLNRIVASSSVIATSEGVVCLNEIYRLIPAFRCWS